MNLNVSRQWIIPSVFCEKSNTLSCRFKWILDSSTILIEIFCWVLFEFNQYGFKLKNTIQESSVKCLLNQSLQKKIIVFMDCVSFLFFNKMFKNCFFMSMPFTPKNTYNFLLNYHLKQLTRFFWIDEKHFTKSCMQNLLNIFSCYDVSSQENRRGIFFIFINSFFHTKLHF